jgi:uncharacterized membrane protein
LKKFDQPPRCFAVAARGKMDINRSLRSHWLHHSRFYLSALLGVTVWGATLTFDERLRLVLAGDVFYATYLIMMTVLAHDLWPAELRKRAAIEDEGMLLIVVLTVAAIAFSLLSLFGLVSEGKSDPPLLGLAIASVPLGWFTLHALFAFRYAHIYYGKAKAKLPGDMGGLDFPGTKEPSGWDFIYHSFVVGMTAQVSDVNATSTAMRKLIWAHSVLSFFYNTVLIALAVNIAVQSS